MPLGSMLTDAVEIMAERKISELPVVETFGTAGRADRCDRLGGAVPGRESGVTSCAGGKVNGCAFPQKPRVYHALAAPSTIDAARQQYVSWSSGFGLRGSAFGSDRLAGSLKAELQREPPKGETPTYENRTTGRAS